jgi:predicted RNA binding protein YcfA (HicA-like mRNA interferase family)
LANKRKILEKILAGSKNVRFSEFVALIEGFGFTFNRIRGSHHIYDHPNAPQSISIQPDRNQQAKPYQMRQFIKLAEKYDLQLEDDEEQDE